MRKDSFFISLIHNVCNSRSSLSKEKGTYRSALQPQDSWPWSRAIVHSLRTPVEPPEHVCSCTTAAPLNKSSRVGETRDRENTISYLALLQHNPIPLLHPTFQCYSQPQHKQKRSRREEGGRTEMTPFPRSGSRVNEIARQVVFIEVEEATGLLTSKCRDGGKCSPQRSIS